jgi:enoyl-CoA hydratase
MSVQTETQNGVATIILDRPDRRNAVDRHHAERLTDAVRRADDDDDIHAVVLWGAGGHFCSGADLEAIAEGHPNRIEQDGPGPMGPTRLQTDIPTIAAVEGYAVAGGLELACWCDLRVAAESATFGVFCRTHGVPLIDGGTVRLPRLIGQSEAMDMILTGRPVDAPEAKSMGLVNRLVDEDDARYTAESLAERLGDFPQRCLQSDRRSTYEQQGLPVDEAMRREFQIGEQSFDADTRRRARRFIDSDDD